MRKFSFCLFLLANSGFLAAQNLVNNPGFESVSAAATTFGQIANATSWYSVYGSADLFNGTASSASVGVPVNYFGTQAAHTGGRYGGIATSNSNSYHELMGVTLSSALTPGTNYLCEAYVSAGEGPYRYGTNNFGFYLTTGAVSGVAADPPVSGPPQVNSTSVITDYTNWTLVSGTFTASAANTHLAIGNFFAVGATTWTLLGTAGSISSQYWFVDDVVVQPNLVLAPAPTSFSARPSGNTQVELNWSGTNISDATEFSVERSADNGQTWLLAGRVKATESMAYSSTDAPRLYNKPLLYRIRQVGRDGTVSRTPSQEVTLSLPQLSETVVVIPSPANPSTGCKVQFNAQPGSLISWVFSDVSGKQLLTGNLEQTTELSTIEIPTQNLGAGMYLISIFSGKETAHKKIQILP